MRYFLHQKLLHYMHQLGMWPLEAITGNARDEHLMRVSFPGVSGNAAAQGSMRRALCSAIAILKFLII